jgi:hypothetical protein
MNNRPSGVVLDGNRPSSNKLDRFGRVAFNKNKEISQASLDVKKDGDEYEEEKKFKKLPKRRSSS